MFDTSSTAAPSAPAADPGELGPAIAPRAAPQPSGPRATPPTPGSKAWAEQPAEARHEQLRGPANPRSRGYSPALEQREAAAARAAGEPPAPTADPQAPPATAGEKVKIGQFEVSEQEFGAMMQRQAQDDLRKATLPPTPQDYKLALPENLTLPGGVEFKFDEAGNKATFDAARAWAHNRGLSQSDFSEMMGLYASHQAQQEAVLAERSRAELAKAGVNAAQRVDAVGKWITGMVGEADARPIRATIITDSHLRFYESLMTKLTSQGSASFSQSHRVPADDNKSIPGYAGMSFEQRRFAQDQNSTRRGGR